ncbi:MAG: CGNR zinc finger domain-containing protein [Gemmatimonadota bacterium]|nr:CGNR zinc finger domain-containing protein [Gemmatimonadota bacterium]
MSAPTTTPALSTPPSSLFASPSAVVAAAALPRGRFHFVGERLWLDFVNTEPTAPTGGRYARAQSADVADVPVRAGDALHDFETFVAWLESAAVLDLERAQGIRRRALQQPAGAAATLVDARRVRATLRMLAERGTGTPQVRFEALSEINRVLGRSAGTRRVELRADGSYARAFVPVGDAFAGLMIPIVESAADAMILGELGRVRRCADSRCPRVFFDRTKNGRRRWCDMATCGNRAKAARHRARRKD